MDARWEASKPPGWKLMGVVRGPREADPVIRSESWVAWATDPNGELAEGSGSYPEQALQMLAVNLRRMRGETFAG